MTKAEMDILYDVREKKEKLGTKIFYLIQAFELETRHSLGSVEILYLPLMADNDRVHPKGFIDDIELHMEDEFNDAICDYESGVALEDINLCYLED